MKRVAMWNYSRNNSKFNPPFDLALLSEEVAEFYQAMAEDNLVDMLDAWCDMRFVFEGIQFKFGQVRYSYESKTLNDFFDNDKFMVGIVDYYSHHSGVSWQIIEDIILATEPRNIGRPHSIREKCYEFVCEANEQKGVEKNNRGKTIKGPKWVDPKERIKHILIEEGVINADGSTVQREGLN